LTKEKWTQVMRDTDFPTTYAPVHAQFEKPKPEEHEQFLKFLHIPETEVSDPEWSREYGG